MVLIILLINLFGMDLSYAVLAGTVLALLLGWKNLPDKLRTFNEGVAKVGPAMVTTGGIGGLWRRGAGLYRSADHSGNHCFSFRSIRPFP